jgi:hypothetical protein
MKQKKGRYSVYWAGNLQARSEDNDYVRLLRLTNIRRGIANFVKILSRSDIPVYFSSGQQSYTDGDNCVVISASDNPEKFDSMVGLALHEASHVKKSQGLFTFVNSGDLAEYCEHELLSQPAYETKAKTLFKNRDKAVQYTNSYLQLIINFLEDRRLDEWCYTESPGYRPYYEARYEEYFYSKFIDSALENPIYRIPTIDSYFVHLINMFNEKADPDALPQLREVWDIIDIRNIKRYDDEMDRWNGQKPIQMIHDAKRILEIFVANSIRESIDNSKKLAKEKAKADQKNAQDAEDTEDSDGADYQSDDSSEGTPSDLPDLDPGKSKTITISNEKGESVTIDKELIDEIKKELTRQKDFINGKIEKKELNVNDQESIAALQAADAELREAGKGISKNAKCKVIFYKTLDENVIKGSSRYPFVGHSIHPHSISESAIVEGTRMGAVLAHQIRVMQDESTLKFSHQRHGKIDKRLVHQLGHNVDNVFAIDHVVNTKPVMVDLSIDSSGSMNGSRWKNALSLAVALCYAADKTRNMRVRVTLRTGQGGLAHVGIIYDSKKDKFEKIPRLWKFLSPNGSTPEGLCYEAIKNELLEGIKQNRRYFINLSDGEPAHSWSDRDSNGYGGYHGYSDIPAANHTAAQVQEIRKAGIQVLAYYITEFEADIERANKGRQTLFHKMYGRDAVYINTSNVRDIARTLNKLFLSELK